MWYKQAQKHYTNAERWRMELHDAGSKNLPVLARELRALSAYRIDNPGHDELIDFHHILHRLLTRAITIPIHASQLLVGKYSIEEIDILASRTAKYLPQLAPTIDRVMRHIRLWYKEKSGLLFCLMDLSKRLQKTGAIFQIADNQFRESIQKHFHKLDIPFKIATKGEINQLPPPSHLIMAGEVYWYTSKILLPPAATVHILKPAWTKTGKPCFPTPFAIGEAYIDHALTLSQPVLLHPESTLPDIQDEETDSPLPEESGLFISLLKSLTASHSHEKCVTARAYLLANEHITFFPADSRLHILKVDSGNNIDVEFIDTSSVKAGHVLLVKHGDNQLSSVLGDQNLALAGCDWQKKMSEWKKPLEKQTRVFGHEYVINKLKIGGSKRANNQNLNNWINCAKLVPKHDDDFMAILRFVGMPGRLTEYKNLASRVKGARLSAAHEIRDLLTGKLSTSNLQQLYETGMQPLSLFEDDQSYIALRVEQTSDRNHEVPVSRIRHQIPLSKAGLNL